MAIVNLKTIGVVEKSKKKKKSWKDWLQNRTVRKVFKKLLKKKTNEDTYVITFDVVP